MIHKYNGNYSFNKKIIQDWDNSQGGVYYCGALNGEGGLMVYYVGKAFGDEGIRGRLLQHLSEDKWSDVTHFGYCLCSSDSEASSFEKSEIQTYKPKYNKIGK